MAGPGDARRRRATVIGRLVILGGTGDLASRELVPALVQLDRAGALPFDLEVVAAARDDLDTLKFRDQLEAELDALDIARSRHRHRVLDLIGYVRADVTDADDLRRVLRDATTPTVLYLALPPRLAETVVDACTANALPTGSIVVFEKPFGHDRASARRLNTAIDAMRPRVDAFRMDHFLGESTVRNVLGVRFANRIFEPLWCAEHIQRVDVVWDETIAVGDRATSYDEVGALRDMVQNHLLQLLALVAMDRPNRSAATELRQAKADALRTVRSMTADDVDEQTVRARYTGGNGVAPYTALAGVDAGRATETFADVTFGLDADRWRGVPFRLRTGKALARDRREIVLTLRPVGGPPFATGARPAPANEIRFAMDPDELTVDLSIDPTGELCSLRSAELRHELGPPGCGPYARLLADILRGDTTWSVGAREAEESWRIVEPVLDAWRRGRSPLREYAAGSPAAAVDAAAADTARRPHDGASVAGRPR
jgi:glucose-6-phosphate 1-dehydrogenase